MVINLITTGNSSSVGILSIGRILTHPETYSILTDFSLSHVLNSQEIQSLIDTNLITVEVDGAVINQLSPFQNVGNLLDVNDSGLSTGSILRYDGTMWTPVQGFYYMVYWAEENAAIAAGQNEYSWGNGSTGNIGFSVPSDGELVAGMAQAESGSGTATIGFRINQDTTTAGTFTFTGSGMANGHVVDLATPIPISEGDVLGFRTTALTGSLTDVRVGAKIKFPIVWE